LNREDDVLIHNVLTLYIEWVMQSKYGYLTNQ